MGLTTHHKSGFVWIKRILSAMRKLWGIPVVGIWSERKLANVFVEGEAFIVNWAGFHPYELWEREGFSSVNLIRDPSDILLSGCHYHHFAPSKGESFLHEPSENLDGLSYQYHLCKLESCEDKLLFEIREKHAQTLKEMVAFPTERFNFFNMRYEDIIVDPEENVFQSDLAYWCFDTSRIADTKQIILDNSLFGGLKNLDQRNDRVNRHVLSAPSLRWKTELPRSVGEVYAKEFGKDFIDLGYEKDDSWIDKLDTDSTPFNLPDVTEDMPAYVQ
jgi:hypothetical protein